MKQPKIELKEIDTNKILGVFKVASFNWRYDKLWTITVDFYGDGTSFMSFYHDYLNDRFISNNKKLEGRIIIK